MMKESGLISGLSKLSSNSTLSPLITPTLLVLDPPRAPLREVHADISLQDQTVLSSYSEKVLINSPLHLHLIIIDMQVANKLAAAKTHTFYIKGMNNFTKHKVEESLIGVKGIVSFLIDVHTHKAVVRTMTSPGTTTCLYLPFGYHLADFPCRHCRVSHQTIRPPRHLRRQRERRRGQGKRA